MNWFKKPKGKPKPSIAEAATAGAGTQVVTSGALREFVYLDEISVYSLTSSPDAPPPVSMSEIASASSAETLKAQLEAGVAGFAKSGLATDLSSARSNGLEVQRQFNIQSQFARLHRLYGESFALAAHAEPTKLRHTDDIAEALSGLHDERRAVRADMLSRGSLTELRVALSAHSMFDVAVFIKSAGGLIERHPELLPVPDSGAIRQMMDLGELLNELMENLVPIEGLATTHQLVRDDAGNDWIVDVGALREVFSGAVVSRPLRVVGVAEQESFWKDTRRILHSNAEFDVLGRIRRGGLQPDWSPVKLTDAFDRVVPGVGDSLREALNTLKQIARTAGNGQDPSPRLALAGARLLDGLAAHHHVEAPVMSDRVLDLCARFKGGLEAEMAVLNEVTADFFAHYETIEPDLEVTASLRQAAWRASREFEELESQIQTEPVEDEPLALELEFIAMYW